MRRLPSWFLSHGSPMVALEPSPARDFLAGLGNSLPRPRAILVLSAHHDAAYQNGRATVTASPAPPTIHDFGGFPEELFAMRYPAPGDPALAQRVVDLLAAHGLTVAADPERGLDHGAWVPLSVIYPDADIPVVQLSIASNASPEWHYALGQALAPLRDEGVLVIGSGSITHNLRAFFTTRPAIGAPAPAWVSDFTAWVAGRMEANAIDDVLHAGSVQATCREHGGGLRERVGDVVGDLSHRSPPVDPLVPTSWSGVTAGFAVSVSAM